ncbi:unnamed protein product [Dovyalis caffra]|uniref:Uncharacterized protein n=1 Tax=Dovyalis caffra TaxID=77055 RepID=A0AAV1QPA8_9ROSI|nr:unnamed protein product [Dovyalis caffra]
MIANSDVIKKYEKPIRQSLKSDKNRNSGGTLLSWNKKAASLKSRDQSVNSYDSRPARVTKRSIVEVYIEPRTLAAERVD